MSDIERPAYYAMRGGGWRDWWSLLHPPYTLWHLSYVVLGAATAPRVRLDMLFVSLAAFFLAMGAGAHALDELNGRPLRTRIPNWVLWALAAASIAGAVALGIAYLPRVGATGIPFIVFGGFIVVAYNLESFGGAFHSDFWFAFAWGFFPALTAAWAQHPHPRAAAFLAAAGCFAASVAQRALSTPVRALRRRTQRVEGVIVRDDGAVRAIDKSMLTRAPEQALRALSYSMPLLAAGAACARLLG
jgi:hypothetical protein